MINTVKLSLIFAQAWEVLNRPRSKKSKFTKLTSIIKELCIRIYL